jgi:hypothetical protein
MSPPFYFVLSPNPQEVLGEMNQAQLRPTVKTLNEVLLQLSYMASFREGKKLALKTLSEMRKFGVKPSLASYNHLLYLFCRDRKFNSLIIRLLPWKSNKVYSNNELLKKLKAEKSRTT